MDWEPSDKMTVDDLKAVLMSWGIEIPKKPSKEMLQKLVANEYKQIMKRLYGHLRHTTSMASSSCAASDKAVGTDLPALVMSFIGSEGCSDIVENSINLIVNELGHKKEIGDDTRDEVEYEQSAACAGEDSPVDFVPSLRRALDMEIEATAKAKAKAKDKKTGTCRGTGNKKDLDDVSG